MTTLRTLKTILEGENIYNLNRASQLTITSYHEEGDSITLDLSKIDEEMLKILALRKVRVKSLEWYKANHDSEGCVTMEGSLFIFTQEMKEYCGKEFLIGRQDENGDCLLINRDGRELPYFWREWMFDDNK